MRVHFVLGAVAVLCLFVVALSIGPQDGHRFNANGLVAKQDLAAIAQAAEQFALDHGGRCPSSIEDLLAGGARQEGYLAGRATVPKDPWKREYLLECSAGTAFRVGTLGRDGKPGGSGDDADTWVTSSGTR
jgi:general secretion pathway protein G